MNTLRTSAVLFVLSAVAALPFAARSDEAADAKAGAARSDADLKSLQGTWQCTALEYEGNDLPAENLKGSRAVYEGNRLTLYRDGEVYRRGIVTVNAAAKPKPAINTWDLNGPYADKTLSGIYEIQGDTLKICYAHAGENRPTDFTTKTGSGFLFGTYQRTKP